MINKLLNIKYPIIQGGMANIATGEFAAAISNAGALGIIASAAMNVEQLKIEVDKCKNLTNKPFGVNVMMMNPHKDEIIQYLIENPVNVVTTGAGNPGDAIKKLKEKDIIVMPVIASVSMAVRMQKYGADAVIAEGTEAGGHVGEITTFSLVPQIVDAVDIPVVAAGGIADGRGFNAAIALGATGVQIGTCLLVSDECPIHDNYKNAVIKASDISTVVTGRSLGSPVRALKNQMTRKYLALEKKEATRDELENLALGSLRKAVFDGDIENGSFMMGQIAGLCKTKKSLSKIFEDMVKGSINGLKILNEKCKEMENI